MPEILRPESGTGNFLDGIDPTSVAEIVHTAGDLLAEPAGADYMVELGEVSEQALKVGPLACIQQLQSGGYDESIWTPNDGHMLDSRFEQPQEITSIY